MLLYIAEQSLSGHEQELTEMKIGLRVFARGDDYVPSEDSIVRSTVRQLRTKLHEYYETDGAAAPWIMEIPKGGFVATFRHRDGTTDDRSKTADPLHPPNRAWWQSTALLLSLGILLAASVSANLWLLLTPAPTSDSHSRSLGLAAWLITTANQPTHVVLDDYAYVLMSTSMPARPSVEDYAERSYIPLSAAPSKDPVFLRLWELLGTRYIVSLGAEATAERILRSTPRQDLVLISHARNTVARDFRNGNFILCGNSTNNPWTELFDDKLNFPFQPGHKQYPGFANRHPKAAEQSFYTAAQPASQNSGVGYARIAYIPNLSHTGFILLLTGLNMVTAEAAGEFATDPARLPAILHLFNVKRPSDLPYFEILLQTKSVDNAPDEVRVVAWRRIAGHP